MPKFAEIAPTICCRLPDEASFLDIGGGVYHPPPPHTPPGVSALLATRSRHVPNRMETRLKEECFRQTSHIDFVHEKRHMDVFLGTLPPHPTPPTTPSLRTLFILQALRLTLVYKSIKVHVGQGQGQDLIISLRKCWIFYT